jgi:hypothetical protein
LKDEQAGFRREPEEMLPMTMVDLLGNELDVPGALDPKFRQVFWNAAYPHSRMRWEGRKP